MRQETFASQENWSNTWKDGTASSFFKGTNGRWRAVPGTGDLVLYEHAAARLEPGLRASLFPEQAAATQGALQECGRLQSLRLLERTEQGRERTHVCRAEFERFSLGFVVTEDAEEKITDLYLTLRAYGLEL